MNDYTPNDSIFSEDEQDMYILKKALNSLELPDKIIMLIYAENGSLRETGKELGVSHTIIYKTIKKIRQQIYDYIKTNYPNGGSVLCSRFERIFGSN
jgi:DNA-directed RNA polymerase specialized sigma subunit